MYMRNKVKWHDEGQDSDEEIVYVDEEGNEVPPPVDELDEVIQSTQSTPQTRSSFQRSKRQTEALRRIQKAKLYEVLITHDLIGEGSADPEIVDEVQGEIQEFFSARLDFLLGLSQDGQPPIVTQAKFELPFSEEQVSALSAIANRLIEKGTEKQPTVNPLKTSDQSLENTRRTIIPQKTKIEVVAPKKIQQKPATKQVVKKVVKTSSSKRKAGQIVNPNKPPVRMPSQSEVDMLNAQQVANTSRGAGDLMTKAIGIAVSQNSSIKEDLGPTD